jgi:hypothetical protein
MLSRNRLIGWIVTLAAIAAYFALAERSRQSFVDLTPPGKAVIQLLPPFEMHGNVAVGQARASETLRSFADDENVENDRRSPVVIYENGKPLGPAHSSYFDIREHGMGRFAHWRNQGIVFTASDNSDPNTNGRTYWAVLPE